MQSNKMTHLPQHWEWKTLENIAEIQIGKTPTRNNLDFFQGENIWLSIRNLKDKFVSSSNEKISDEAIAKTNMKKVPKGTLLMSFKLTLGKTAFADCDLYTNEAIAAIFIKDKNVDKYFLDYALKFTNLDKYVDNAVKGKTLNKQKLKQIEIPLPPLKEQGRIVGILDLAFEKIDTSVELLKANLANLDELAKSVLDRAFNPLGDSADSTESTKNPSTHDTQSPYPLPQHWEWKSLGEMCKILNGGTPDTKNPVFWDLNQSHEVQTDKSVVGVGGEVERGEGATSQFKPLHPLAKEKSYYWATLVDTKQKYLYSTQRKITQKGLDSSNATLLPVNSVIFSSRASIGEVCIAKVETATNQGYKNFVCDENVLYYEFLYFALQRFAKEIESLAQGTTYKEVSKAKISEFQIPLPKDIKEQEQIAMHLDSVFDKIQKLKELYNAQLQDYEELKQSLLTQAFSGKL